MTSILLKKYLTECEYEAYSNLKLENYLHGSRTLNSHSIGVLSLMDELNLEKDHCKAGLLHFIYGAESYPELSFIENLIEMVKSTFPDEVISLIKKYSLISEKSLYVSIKFNNRSWLVNRFSSEPLLLTNQEYEKIMWLFLCNALEQFNYWKINDLKTFQIEFDLEGQVWQKLAQNLGEKAIALSIKILY